MLQNLRFLGFVLLCLGPLLAQAQTDSAAWPLREVEVLGERVGAFAVGSRIQTIDTTFLRHRNTAHLGDILQTRTGLYLKNYGAGQLTSVSFRGTASRHTAVLWHGLNINLPTLGETDFSLLPAAAISEVAIQHGSAGANHGSGAIGGAVLLSAPVSWRKGLRLSWQLDGGSYGHRFGNVGASYGKGAVAGTTTLYHNQADNDFPFQNTARFGSPEERNQNAAVRTRGVTQDLHFRLGKQTHLSVRGWYTDNQAQVQPTMSAAHNHASRADQNLRLMTELSTKRRIGQLTWRTAWFNDRMQYSSLATDSYSDVDTYQTQGEYETSLRTNLHLKTGGELQHFRADVSGYRRLVQENRASLFALLRYDPFRFLNLSLNLRQGMVTGFNPPPTPALGLLLKLYESSATTLSAKGNLARSYRVPTLNERFWPTGNPDILPESGRSHDLGLAHTLRLPTVVVSTEATYYNMWVDNWTSWEPIAPNGAFTPINLQQVQARGMELSTDATFSPAFGTIGVGARYSYTSSEQRKVYTGANSSHLGKQLVYVPRHNASLFSDLTLGTWTLNTTWTYTGIRYTRPENTSWLNPFLLGNLSGGRTFRLGPGRFQALVQIQNLTNTRYQTVQHYAMPPRHYRGSLRYFLP